MTPFDGLGMNMGNLACLSEAQTRSISPENFTGEKGKGGMAVEGTGSVSRRGEASPGTFSWADNLKTVQPRCRAHDLPGMPRPY